jgi:hypothetical protein
MTMVEKATGIVALCKALGEAREERIVVWFTKCNVNDNSNDLQLNTDGNKFK